MQPQTIKHKIYVACYDSDTSKASLGLQLGMSLLIALNILAVVLETVEMFREPYAKAFRVFELFSVTVFAVEYLIRVWIANLDARYQHPLSGRIRYMFTPMALVDLIAILPFFLALAGFDLRVLRVLRLMRLFKLTRYSRAMNTLGGAIKASKEELTLTVLVMGILLVLSSTLIYFAEHDAQPEAFSSIPASLWWAVVTMTTIGYGDVYPITVAGKIVAGMSAILGIGMFALPGGIIASELISRSKSKNTSTCPHCGKNI